MTAILCQSLYSFWAEIGTFRLSRCNTWQRNHIPTNNRDENKGIYSPLIESSILTQLHRVQSSGPLFYMCKRSFFACVGDLLRSQVCAGVHSCVNQVSKGASHLEWHQQTKNGNKEVWKLNESTQYQSLTYLDNKSAENFDQVFGTMTNSSEQNPTETEYEFRISSEIFNFLIMS